MMSKPLSLASALLFALAVTACKSEVRRDSDQTTITSGELPASAATAPAVAATLDPPAPPATATPNVSDKASTEPEVIDLDNVDTRDAGVAPRSNETDLPSGD